MKLAEVGPKVTSLYSGRWHSRRLVSPLLFPRPHKHLLWQVPTSLAQLPLRSCQAQAGWV